MQDKSGADISSRDGKRMELMRTNSIDSVISDIVSPINVPGGPTSMADVQIGPYKANFDGIFKSGIKIVQWSSCCAG